MFDSAECLLALGNTADRVLSPQWRPRTQPRDGAITDAANSRVNLFVLDLHDLRTGRMNVSLRRRRTEGHMSTPLDGGAYAAAATLRPLGADTQITRRVQLIRRCSSFQLDNPSSQLASR